MTVGDYLALIGELAIGVAGFSGIVAALTRRSTAEWRPADVLRLQMLLRTAVTVAMWAVVPALLLSSGLTGPIVWRAISGVWLTLTPFFVLPEARRAREVLAEYPGDASRSFTILILVGLLFTYGLQAANVLVIASPWPHLISLAWGLFVALVLFLRLATMVFSSPGSAG